MLYITLVQLTQALGHADLTGLNKWLLSRLVAGLGRSRGDSFDKWCNAIALSDETSKLLVYSLCNRMLYAVEVFNTF